MNIKTGYTCLSDPLLADIGSIEAYTKSLIHKLDFPHQAKKLDFKSNWLTGQQQPMPAHFSSQQ
jgi:hypothetical protein